MYLSKLSLTEFRNYEAAELEFVSDGLVVFRGDNGQGKTNLLEAICYLATSKSFRETASETLIRASSESAVIRGVGFNRERELLIEGEISRTGRNRLNVNRQPIRRGRSLDDTLAVTTFSPDDLELVKSGPAYRRNYVDGLLAGSDERQRALQADLERVLKQRNSLLRQSGGRISSEIEATLDVWDERLSTIGEQIGQARSALSVRLQPLIQDAYREISGAEAVDIGVEMTTEWRQEDGGKGLLETLFVSRQQDLARGTTSSGPHRDELQLTVAGLPARTHASQGEQRSLAISMRLAGHNYVADARQSTPLLLLDDVFSELDDGRTEKLLNSLPRTQCFLATAVDIPKSVQADQHLLVSNGRVTK